MSDSFFLKNGFLVAFNPIQIYEGLTDGLPKLTAEELETFLNPPIDILELLESVKFQIRTTRAPMLDALSGIAGRGQRAGNTALAAEADALAEALLNITDDPVLNAAQTWEDMQAACVAAYRAIASTASAELAVVFKEHIGV